LHGVSATTPQTRAPGSTPLRSAPSFTAAEASSFQILCCERDQWLAEQLQHLEHLVTQDWAQLVLEIDHLDDKTAPTLIYADHAPDQTGANVTTVLQKLSSTPVILILAFPNSIGCVSGLNLPNLLHVKSLVVTFGGVESWHVELWRSMFHSLAVLDRSFHHRVNYACYWLDWLDQGRVALLTQRGRRSPRNAVIPDTRRPLNILWSPQALAVKRFCDLESFFGTNHLVRLSVPRREIRERADVIGAVQDWIELCQGLKCVWYYCGELSLTRIGDVPVHEALPFPQARNKAKELLELNDDFALVTEQVGAQQTESAIAGAQEPHPARFLASSTADEQCAPLVSAGLAKAATQSNILLRDATVIITQSFWLCFTLTDEESLLNLLSKPPMFLEALRAFGFTEAYIEINAKRYPYLFQRTFSTDFQLSNLMGGSLMDRHWAEIGAEPSRISSSIVSITDDNEALWARAQQLQSSARLLHNQLTSLLPALASSIKDRLGAIKIRDITIDWECEVALGDNQPSASTSDVEVLVILSPRRSGYSVVVELESSKCWLMLTPTSSSSKTIRVPIGDNSLSMIWQAFVASFKEYTEQHKDLLNISETRAREWAQLEDDPTRAMKAWFSVGSTSVEARAVLRTSADELLMLLRSCKDDGSNVVKRLSNAGARGLESLPDKARQLVCALKHVVKEVHGIKTPRMLFESVVLEVFEQRGWIGDLDDVELASISFVEAWRLCWHRILSWRPISAPNKSLEEDVDLLSLNDKAELTRVGEALSSIDEKSLLDECLFGTRESLARLIANSPQLLCRLSPSRKKGGPEEAAVSTATTKAPAIVRMPAQLNPYLIEFKSQSLTSSSSSSLSGRSGHSNAPAQETQAAASSMDSTTSSTAASMASAEVLPPKPEKKRSLTVENSAMWQRAQELRAPTHPLLPTLETELQDIKTSVAAQLNKRVHFGGQVSWTCDFYLGGSASHNVVTSSAKANDLDVLVILKPSGAKVELDQYICSLSNAGANIPIDDTRLELFWQAFSQGMVLFTNQYQGALQLRQFELDGQTSFVAYELGLDRQMRCTIELKGRNTSVDLLPAFETSTGLHLILRRQVGQMFADQGGTPVFANIVKSFSKLAVRRIAYLPDKGRLMICAMKHVKAVHKLKVPSCLFEAVVLEYFDKNNFLGLEESHQAIWELPFITIWEKCWHRIVSWEPIAAPGAALRDENLFESIERKSLQTAQQLRTLARHLEWLDDAAVAALRLTLPNKPRAEQDELALLEELNKMPVHSLEHKAVEAVVVPAPVVEAPFVLSEWLNELGLPQYHDAFVENDLVGPEDIAEITADELKEIGVIVLVHRRKLLAAAAKLKRE